MAEIQDLAIPRDLLDTRTIVLENGSTYVISRDNDPHGFWFIHMKQGQTPERLQGAYTSFDLAHKAIHSYVLPKSHYKQIKEVKQ